MKRAVGALSTRSGALALVIVALVSAVSAIQPLFLSPGNVRSILLDITILTVLAASQLLVMVTGNFDISVGAATGLSAMTAGITLQANGEIPAIAVFGISMAVGTLVGIVNGLLVVLLEIPSIILTLGMLSVVRGVTFFVANGSQVNSDDVPQSVTELSQTGPFGIPLIILVAGLVALIIGFVASQTSLGRSLYALGSNRRAAALHGLPVRRLLLFVFSLSGATAGLAGAFYLSRFSFVQVNGGIGLELSVIAAVVVGGASVFGGSGSVGATVMGCLLLGITGNALAVIGVSQYWKDFVYGAIILAAVITGVIISRRSERARGVRI